MGDDADAYTLYRQGLDAMAAGHADEALAPLERARRLEPDSNSILEALGKTYLAVGFHDRAVETFDTIVERDPVDAYAHYCLGRAHDRIGNLVSARQHYRLAAFFDPDRRLYRNTFNAFLARAFPAGGEGGSPGGEGTSGPMVFGD